MNWLVVVGAIFQVILLLLQSHGAKEEEVKKLKADKAKEISDAIASGDISRINDVVGKLRE